MIHDGVGAESYYILYYEFDFQMSNSEYGNVMQILQSETYLKLSHNVDRTLAIKLQYTVKNVDFVVSQRFLAMTMELEDMTIKTRELLIE